MREIYVISGFSGTLKSTLVKKLAKDNHLLPIVSPTKRLIQYDKAFDNECKVDSLTSMLTQLTIVELTNADVICERFIWDHLAMYFILETSDYNETNLDFDKIKNILPKAKYKVILLKNDSQVLKDEVLRTLDPTRAEIYTDLETYNSCQEDFLWYCKFILSNLGIEYNIMNITDDRVIPIFNENGK